MMPGLGDKIIHIYLDDYVNEVMEGRGHNMLVCHPSILKAKGHDAVAICM